MKTLFLLASAGCWRRRRRRRRLPSPIRVLNYLAYSQPYNVLYLAARDSTDANNSGWQAMGSLTVQQWPAN